MSLTAVTTVKLFTFRTRSHMHHMRTGLVNDNVNPFSRSEETSKSITSKMDDGITDFSR